MRLEGVAVRVVEEEEAVMVVEEEEGEGEGEGRFLHIDGSIGDRQP